MIPLRAAYFRRSSTSQGRRGLTVRSRKSWTCGRCGHHKVFVDFAADTIDLIAAFVECLNVGVECSPITFNIYNKLQPFQKFDGTHGVRLIRLLTKDLPFFNNFNRCPFSIGINPCLPWKLYRVIIAHLLFFVNSKLRHQCDFSSKAAKCFHDFFLSSCLTA